MPEKSVLVVGGGIIGASVAWHLAKTGVKVTLIEQHQVAAKASSSSFGWINATASESSQYYELRRQAMKEYRDLLNDYRGEGVLTNAVRFSGSVWWETPGQELRDLCSRLHNYGHTVREIDREEFVEIEPNVANPPETCLYSEDDGAAEGSELAHFFLTQASVMGVTLLAGVELKSLVVEGGAVTGALTSHGRMNADQVVLATGTATASLAEAVGLNIPMSNRRGLIVHTQVVEPVITTVINTEDIHFRQAADGHIVMGEIFSGGVDHEEHGVQTPEQLADDMLERLKKRLPGVKELALEHIQLGTRPVPADGYPVVGTPTGLSGLYIVATHSGITLAPLLGRLVSLELTGSERSTLLAHFHPDRFIELQGAKID